MGSIFQARLEGPRHHQNENILRCVQKALTTSVNEFDELIALKKESPPGPDQIPCGACRCAGCLGSQLPPNAYQCLLEGGYVPEHFAESWTVFITKTSDIDDDGRIIGSPDALLTPTPRTCDCKLLSSAIPCGQRSKTRLSSERLLVCDCLRPFLQMAPRVSYTKEP